MITGSAIFIFQLSISITWKKSCLLFYRDGHFIAFVTVPITADRVVGVSGSFDYRR